MSGEGESVEQAAAARRERLRALRAAQELLNTPDDHNIHDVDAVLAQNDADNSINGNGEDVSGTSDENQENNVNMKFRNYLPHDKNLQEGKLAPPILPKFEDPISAAPPQEEKNQDPFLNIAPKKPNWDLRRDVQRKFDKLEKRTQKALYKLMEQENEKKMTEEVEQMA